MGHGHLHLRAHHGRHPLQLQQRLEAGAVPPAHVARPGTDDHGQLRGPDHRGGRQGLASERRVPTAGRGRELGRALPTAVVPLRRRGRRAARGGGPGPVAPAQERDQRPEAAAGAGAG